MALRLRNLFSKRNEPTRTGSLFYHDSLAWTSCTVSLEHNKLRLSSYSTIHEILLSGCSDIRSLSVSDDLKPFEMTFVDGRSKETFAAKSVRERAGWISAIWDAVLPATPIPLLKSLPPIPSKQPVNLHLDIPSPSPIREHGSSFLSSPSTTIRATPLTASTYPSETSRPPSIITSPPVSPSILNLSHLSVVRQRLAQIERNHSYVSVQSGSPITPISTKSNTSWKDRSSHAEDDSPRPTKQYLSRQIAEVKGVLGGVDGHPTIHQVVLGLDDRSRSSKRMLKTIQERIDDFESSLKDIQSSLAPRKKDEPTLEQVLNAIEDVRVNIRSVDKVQRREYLDLPKSENLKPVLDKLDGLRLMFQDESRKISGGEHTILQENVEQVLSIVQQESEKREVLSQQQADSVRYLNELNNWLDTFVNNGTSQIQGLSANVEQLCRVLLGSSSTSSDSEGTTAPPPLTSLLSDIRGLVAGMQARDQNFAALQAAVHSLLEVLTLSQTQMGAESQAIAGLISDQRRQQEALLRTFTNEISGEIKGERLRFVEAMKEATAINVQLHVEHFKQDLNREVMAMTEQVGRLHREKQTIENQISDLFAFYSKHKQNEPINHREALPELIQYSAPTPTRRERNPPRAHIPRSHHRPLPYPGAS